MTKFRESELLAKKVSGTLSEKERAELTRWEEESEAHRCLSEKVTQPDFIRMAAENHMGEAERSWEKMRRKLPALDPNVRKRPSRLRRAVAIAASIAIVTGVATLAYWHPWQDTILKAGSEKAVVRQADGTRVSVTQMQPLRPIASLGSKGKSTVIEVPRGGEYTCILPDSTEVHLNADSRLEIPSAFSPRLRRVRLRGEAYFKVRHNARSPFSVDLADGSSIRVYGTEFNARQYTGEQPEVTLLTGHVGFNKAQNEFRLQPGEQARVNADGTVSVRQVNTYIYSAWHHHRIAYEGERLDEIMDDLGRWYDFEASFSNDKMRSLRFTIDIDRQKDFNDIADILRRTEKARIRIRGRQVLISEI